jgi:hypothetical protein
VNFTKYVSLGVCVCVFARAYACASALKMVCFGIYLKMCLCLSSLFYTRSYLLSGGVKSYELELFENNMHTFQLESQNQVTLMSPANRAPQKKGLDSTSFNLKLQHWKS